nr:hypothetical protein [Tanacetum cinerariifolium]
MYKKSKLFPKFPPLKREFNNTPNLFLPNDLQKLIEKSIQMEEESDVIDRELEEVTQSIQKEDVGDTSNDEETFLSQYITRREKEKDDLVGHLEQLRSSAIIEGRDREARLGFLDIVDQTTTRDIETLEFIKEQLAGHEDDYEEVIRLLAELKSQEANVAALIEEFHANDLPPITSTQSSDETSQAQNSEQKSNLDDYADTSCEMPSYMDPED